MSTYYVPSTVPGPGDAVCSGQTLRKYEDEGRIRPRGRCLTYRRCFLSARLLKANCIAAGLANSSRALFKPRFAEQQEDKWVGAPDWLKQNTPKNASLVSTSGGRNNLAGAGWGLSHSFLSAHSTLQPALRWAPRGHAQSRTPWRSSWRTQVAPNCCDQDWGQEDARTAPGQTWSSFHCEGTEAEGKARVREPGRRWPGGRR